MCGSTCPTSSESSGRHDPRVPALAALGMDRSPDRGRGHSPRNPGRLGGRPAVPVMTTRQEGGQPAALVYCPECYHPAEEELVLVEGLPTELRVCRTCATYLASQPGR